MFRRKKKNMITQYYRTYNPITLGVSEFREYKCRSYQFATVFKHMMRTSVGDVTIILEKG